MSLRGLGVRNGVIYGCVETHGGNKRRSATLKLANCHKGFKRIAWNIRGRKGAEGRERSRNPGAAGAAGAAGARRAEGRQGRPWARLDSAFPNVVVTHITSGRDFGHCGGQMGLNGRMSDYTRTLQFIPQNDGSIQVVRSYDGTFTTVAGAPTPNPPTCPGPPQTGGVTGTFTGYDVVVVTGGVFHPEATCPDPCITSTMVATFFPAEGGPPGASTINNGWEYQYAQLRTARGEGLKRYVRSTRGSTARS